MQKNIPARLNLVLCTGMLGAVLAQMIVMPIILAQHVWIMAVIVIGLSPLNVAFWSLIHEAVHKNLLPGSGNEILARAMSIVYGASFDVLRFGHLMHHQHNRMWESEIYDPAKQNTIYVWANHYFKMLGGLYLTEIFTSCLVAISPLPVAQRIARASFADEKHQQAILNGLLKPATVRRLRIDTVLIILFYALAFALFAGNWPVLVLLLAGRAMIISLMDNAYHYGTPADNSVIAKELELPGPLAAFVLNFNHHVTHHRNTGLPWTELKAQHEAQQIAYTQGLASALFAQFKGPIKGSVSNR